MSLTSAQRKLAWGIKHVQTLRREAQAYENGEAYVLRVERKRRSPQEIEYRCFAVERKPLPSHWPLLAGDALQSLRSALDHVIWSAVPKRKRGDRTQFPIFVDHCEFEVLGRRMIPGIPESVRAAVERAQPYRASPHAPTRDPLELLRTLSNIDKHRTLAAVISAVHYEAARTHTGVWIKWMEYALNKPLGHGETHISTFIASTTEQELDEMDVKPRFTYQVRVEGRPLNVLVEVAKRVFEVVTECETGEPLPPFVTYPIR